ncbi:MAG: peptidylprolyl isomerase, partial [Chromatiales bacterium]|nr:peptidylprolyl isomerase [Chromatiales bacterium]
DAAKAAIEALNGGADFAELAKEKSTGPSAPKGGDLGWFVADSMVPPFAQALKALEVGKYTTAPVQTQFGWHVILLEETRPLEPPPFEAVKDQVRQQMLQKSLQDYLEGLKTEAKIELK